MKVTNGLLLVGIGVVLVVVAVLVWRSQQSSVPLPESPSFSPNTSIHFEDVTSSSGIDFVHFDSATPMHYIQETMGSGLAWIDFDADGWQDLFCVQVCPVFPDSSKPQPTARLYRNKADGTFADVTEQVGLNQSGYGMGCAVGDFDNDGFDDLIVTYFRGVRLYHNQSDGKGGRRFLDITAKAGLRNPHWGTSCGWGDIDNDGFLDLYVCNYVEVNLKNYTPCINPKFKERYACAPRVFPSTTHRLYRNNGDATFTDISKSSGIADAPPAPGLGVVLVDLDRDGHLDIYAANDMMPAYLFHNQRRCKFIEQGVLSGAALQLGGRYMAGMGVGVGDVAGNGLPSILVTNYQKEPNNLFLNKGKVFFDDRTFRSGLGPASIPYLGFGVVLFDANLDGLLDAAVANGHVLRNAERLEAAPHAQNAQLFQGTAPVRFEEVSAAAGSYFRRKLVGRGLAWADYDNDGRPDLAFSHNGGPLVLLRNTTASPGHWVGLELIGDGKKSNRSAIGARVEVEADGKQQTHFIIGGGSYLSASDRRVLAGLGAKKGGVRVKVTWPSGRQQEFAKLQTDRWWRLHEGKADPMPATHRK